MNDDGTTKNGGTPDIPDEALDRMLLIRQLCQQAAEVRAAQKRYFADRTQANLIASKQLEAELDRLIAVVFAQEQVETEERALAGVRTVHFSKVREFMVKAGQRVRERPSLKLQDAPTLEERQRAANLILEEAGELIGGLGFALEFNLDESEEGFDFVESVDGVFDLQVVSTCVLAMLGVPDMALRNSIDDNNLAKFGPGHSIREDGKLVKPADHKPVDIIAKLEEIGAFSHE